MGCGSSKASADEPDNHVPGGLNHIGSERISKAAKEAREEEILTELGVPNETDELRRLARRRKTWHQVQEEIQESTAKASLSVTSVDTEQQDLISAKRKEIRRQKWLEVLEKDGLNLAFAEDGIREDREMVLLAVGGNGKALEFASEELQADKDVVTAAVSRDGIALKFAAEHLRADKALVAVAVGNNTDALKFAHRDLTADTDIMLQAVRTNRAAIEHAHERLRTDRDFITKAVSSDGFLLVFADDALRADRDIVDLAMETSWETVKFAHPKLKANKDFMMRAAKKDARALQYADEDLKADRDVFRKAVAMNDGALLYAHEDLWHDREIILKAVAQSGVWLDHVEDHLRQDREVLLEAVAHDSFTRRHVAKEVLEDEDFNKEADKKFWLDEIARHPNELWKAPDWVKGDKQVIFRALLQLGILMKAVHGEDEEDAEQEKDTFASKSIAQANHCLRFAHEEVRADRQIVLQAVSDWGCALQFAHDDLRADRAIVKRAVAKEGFALKFAAPDLQADKEIVLLAVSRCGIALQFAHKDLRADREVVVCAIKQNGRALPFASKAFFCDKEIILMVLRSGHAVHHDLHSLRRDLDIIRAQRYLHSGLARGKRISHTGRVRVTPSRGCIASFPGVEAHRLERLMQGSVTSSACVFMASAADGLGKHGETCACREIYGQVPQEAYVAILEKPTLPKEQAEYDERRSIMIQDAETMGQIFIEEAAFASTEEFEKAKYDAREEAGEAATKNLHKAPWGCRWFEAWKENIELARLLNLDLLVYFLPGKVNQGIIEWDRLGCGETVKLADQSSGLGPSQRAEVAWLNKKGYPWKAVDVSTLGSRE